MFGTTNAMPTATSAHLASLQFPGRVCASHMATIDRDNQEHVQPQPYGQDVTQNPVVKQLPGKRNRGVAGDVQMRTQQQDYDHRERRDQDLGRGQAPAGDCVSRDDQCERQANVYSALG